MYRLLLSMYRNTEINSVYTAQDNERIHDESTTVEVEEMKSDYLHQLDRNDNVLGDNNNNDNNNKVIYNLQLETEAKNEENQCNNSNIDIYLENEN